MALGIEQLSPFMEHTASMQKDVNRCLVAIDPSDKSERSRKQRGALISLRQALNKLEKNEIHQFRKALE